MIKKINNTKISKDPLVILGHWRSGTTYLHNLLSLDENLGFFTTFDALCQGIFLNSEDLLKPLINNMMLKKIPMDEVKIGADLPQEEEYALAVFTTYSIHNSICFSQNPSRYNKYVCMKDISKKEYKE